MAALGSELGNAVMLAKIDKLRELNLVVVGDQSSGKSSVLESLTGFSFPRDVGLCTRYATQITCFRDPIRSVTVSIIPRPDAHEELKAKLLGFKRQANELSNDDLANIFHEANTVMGIRMTTDAENPGSVAFSQDILKIEIHGPDQSHLTVIDVPGIFRVPTPGLTTVTDIMLIESMVKSYMSNSRTIILAVMPCNVDIATQEILKLAEVADPEGARTMGVLTKPDLATEAATREAVMDLVLGKRSDLKLGYYVVKNRSADDKTSTLAQRVEGERAFFMAPPWTRVSDRCGIAALKGCLRRLLMKISKVELPHVQREIKERLRKCKADLETMGPARADQNSQRLYLGKLAGRVQAITHSALNGYYAGEDIFSTHPKFKLITRIIHLNEGFANSFWTSGHLQDFEKEQVVENEPLLDDDAASDGYCDDAASDGSCDDAASDSSCDNASDDGHDKAERGVLREQYPELAGIILAEKYECPQVLMSTIMESIEAVYQSNRGPELGTYGGTILSSVFSKQSEKWEPLALSHASDAIAMVHDFMFCLIEHLCPEKQVRSELWEKLLIEELCEKYRKAMDHTRFLLAIERGGRPSTFNHYFADTLQNKRAERLYKPLLQKATHVLGSKCQYVEVGEIRRRTVSKKNSEQVCEDILDTLTSYYKLARKRFVDVLCQHVISHYLLEGAESPTRLFSPEFVMGLDADQLESIAGEDEESKEQRQVLQRDVKNLEAALKVL
ncbi:interferon-induced GTP-binding protein Mx2 [Ophiocordyceps sinensis CO18]|uniref:Interferon-induced GTP-binding protein Mx2 n=1 Tax=Ophiocordyceps sinensis (strain Co18 / CGMCC 3.14243) TaxID=911162 RepID=T5A9R8_OPHSC|nr:interferon-induced GTP-binding protein Mx2 [Ophiocordyceps sinensis CO18]